MARDSHIIRPDRTRPVRKPPPVERDRQDRIRALAAYALAQVSSRLNAEPTGPRSPFAPRTRHF